jgi:hypothetical protein
MNMGGLRVFALAESRLFVERVAATLNVALNRHAYSSSIWPSSLSG